MARPRNSKLTKVDNLYAKVVKEVVYYQYKDIRTGKFHGLGKDRNKAERQARQLNALIAQQIIDQETAAILAGDNSMAISVESWHKQYIEIQRQRVSDGKIKESTFNSRCWQLKKPIEMFGKEKLGHFTTLKINKVLKHYTSEGKDTMAQRVRSALIDFFKEAVYEGHFPADKPNPATVSRTPKIKIRRSRLTLDVFKRALAWAQENQMPQQWKAYLLALLTGQRLDDICNLRRRPTKLEHLGMRHNSGITTIDGIEYLAIVQKKTGNKVLIPLDLRLNSIGYSVSEVLELCSGSISYEYALCHTKHTGRAKPGDRIRLKTISNGFAKAIAALDEKWGEKTPPSFHEIRSLTEREYSAQGINTQQLLGHKHQTMTDTYADRRGDDWVTIKIS